MACGLWQIKYFAAYFHYGQVPFTAFSVKWSSHGGELKVKGDTSATDYNLSPIEINIMMVLNTVA
jgi:hypothetical protein